jgi:CRP-like cAMP-binding protein
MIMREVKILKESEAFGELALMSRQPRKARITTKEECHFAQLDKENFTRILSWASSSRKS